MKLTGLIYARDLLSSHKDSVDRRSVDRQLTKMDSMMRNPQPVWYNASTNNTGNGNLWEISLIYSEFKYLITGLYQRMAKRGMINYGWHRDRKFMNTFGSAITQKSPLSSMEEM